MDVSQRGGKGLSFGSVSRAVEISGVLTHGQWESDISVTRSRVGCLKSEVTIGKAGALIWDQDHYGLLLWSSKRPNHGGRKVQIWSIKARSVIPWIPICGILWH